MLFEFYIVGGTSGIRLELGNGIMFYLSVFDKSVFLKCVGAKAHAANKKIGSGASHFLLRSFLAFFYMCKIIGRYMCTIFGRLIFLPLMEQNCRMI